MRGESSHGARLSVFIWGVYLATVGATLVMAPVNLAAAVDLATPRDFWVRISGVGMLVGSGLYLGASIHRATWFYWYSVPLRIFVAVAFAALSLFDDVWQLWLFAALEIVGAGWTFVALRWRASPPR